MPAFVERKSISSKLVPNKEGVLLKYERIKHCMACKLQQKSSPLQVYLQWATKYVH